MCKENILKSQIVVTFNFTEIRLNLLKQISKDSFIFAFVCFCWSDVGNGLAWVASSNFTTRDQSKGVDSSLETEQFVSPAWPDWAIFRQKYRKFGLLKNVAIEQKTIVTTFWATFGIIGLLYILIPGHIECDQNWVKFWPQPDKQGRRYKKDKYLFYTNCS